MRLLLLSNSSNYGEDYLQFGKIIIKDFIGRTASDILFIPYAAVTVSWDDYEAKVNAAFSGSGLIVKSLHHFNDPKRTLKNADCIVVGGGNTFHLLAKLHDLDLLQIIRDLVTGGIPYVGWSAGSNIASPTIQTTNDMPVINSGTFQALSLVPFQLNPHYTDKKIPEHNGESRADRLLEFITVNRKSLVVGLPEGMAIEIIDKNYRLIGNKEVMVFRYGHAPEPVMDSGKFNELIHSMDHENSHRS